MEAETVHRFFTLLAFFVMVGPLVAAAAPTVPPPVVIVYPFTPNGKDVTADSSSRLAVIIANQLAAAGGLLVKPPPLSVERKDYLETARKNSADYYVAGYITPIGDDVTVVEQVVSTITGVVVFSNTAQLHTYADAAGQGDMLAAAIIRHSQRNLAAYVAPPAPIPSPTAEPTGQPEANLGKLFGRKKAPKSTPAPTAAPTATAVALAPVVAATAAPTAAATTAPTAVAVATPTPRPFATATPAPRPVATTTPPLVATRGDGYALTAISGSADAERRDYAAQSALAFVTRSGKHVSLVAVSAGDVRARASELCASASATAILALSLGSHSETVFGSVQTSSTADLTAYSCSGNVTYHKTFDRDAGGDWKLSVDRAVSAALGAYLNPPKR